MSTSAGVLDRPETRDDVLHWYFDLIVEQAPVPVHVVDADFKVTNVNRPWLDRLGYERSEVLGRPSTDFLSGESRERASSDMLPLFQIVGCARSVGVNFETKDGRAVPALLDAQVCCTDDGHWQAFAVMRDLDDAAQYAEASATFMALRSIALGPHEVGSPAAAPRVPIGADEDDGSGPLVDEAAGAHSQPLPRLTKREHEVLTGLASGARNKEIAAELGTTLRTVRFHVENIYQKLNVQSAPRPRGRRSTGDSSLSGIAVRQQWPGRSARRRPGAFRHANPVERPSCTDRRSLTMGARCCPSLI